MAITKIVKGPIKITNGRFNNACNAGWKVQLTFRLAENKQTTLQSNTGKSGYTWDVKYTGSKIQVNFNYSGTKKTLELSYELAPNVWYDLDVLGEYSSSYLTIKVKPNAGTTWTSTGRQKFSSSWSSSSTQRTVVLGDINVEFGGTLFLQGNSTGFSTTESIRLAIENSNPGSVTFSGSSTGVKSTVVIEALNQTLNADNSTYTLTEGGTLSWQYSLSNTDIAYSYSVSLAIDGIHFASLETTSGTFTISGSELFTRSLANSYTATLTAVTRLNGSQVGVASSVSRIIILSEDMSGITCNFSGFASADNLTKQCLKDSNGNSYVASNGINYRDYIVQISNTPATPDNIAWSIDISIGHSSITTTDVKSDNFSQWGYFVLANVVITENTAVPVTIKVTSPRTKNVKTYSKTIPLCKYIQPTWKAIPDFDCDNENITWKPVQNFNTLAQTNVANYYENGNSIGNSLTIDANINGTSITNFNQTSFKVSGSSPYILSYSFTDELGAALGCPAAIIGREVFVTTVNGVVARSDSKGMSFGGPVGDPNKVMFYWRPYLVNGETITPVKPISIAKINSLFNK